MSTPILHLLAGPNGAGKTTLVERVLQPTTHLPFVNADRLAAERWPGDEARRAYDAAQLADSERQRLMLARSSFIAETVFSHPSKLALAEQASMLGYLVHLHVILVPVELAIARVAERVRRGGHEVPGDKVRHRYERLWPLVAQATAIADRSSFYDNSVASSPLQVVARFEHGLQVGRADWPAWTPEIIRALSPTT